MEIRSWHKEPLFNIKSIIGFNSFEGVAIPHVEIRDTIVYPDGTASGCGLINFPSRDEGTDVGNYGNEMIDVGDKIFSIYCHSMTSDRSKPIHPSQNLIPVKIIRK